MSMDTAFMADQFSEPLDVPLVLHLHVPVVTKGIYECISYAILRTQDFVPYTANVAARSC